MCKQQNLRKKPLILSGVTVSPIHYEYFLHSSNYYDMMECHIQGQSQRGKKQTNKKKTGGKGHVKFPDFPNSLGKINVSEMYCNSLNDKMSQTGVNQRKIIWYWESAWKMWENYRNYQKI